MKLDNIEIGMTIPNYKALCKILGLKPTTGMGRQNQIAWIEDYVKYEKQGYKFIIKDVYSDLEIIPMKDNRGGCTYVADYPACKVDFDDWKSIGIYKITRGKEIYIGSTAVGFRKRFLGHLDSKSTIPTLEMLNNGAVFEILHKCNDMTDREIRKLEKKYIRHYESMPKNYILINQAGLAKNKRKKLYEYKIIKRFDTRTNNMVTEYKKGHKLLHEVRQKIDNDEDVARMMELIREEDVNVCENR